MLFWEVVPIFGSIGCLFGKLCHSLDNCSNDRTISRLECQKLLLVVTMQIVTIPSTVFIRGESRLDASLAIPNHDNSGIRVPSGDFLRSSISSL